MLHAAFAKSTAANVPAAHSARENHLHRMLALAFVALQTLIKTQFAARAPQQTRGWWGQQFFTGAIYQSQSRFTVKSKSRHIDLGHHCAQQSSRLERAQSLFAQRLSEVVDFEHYFAERITGRGPSTADRVIA